MKIFTFVLQCVAMLAAGIAQSNGDELPAVFQHDLIFLEPRTKSGEVIRFHTDTGGGWNMIRKAVAGRLHLKASGTVTEGEREFDLVRYPDFDPTHSIPGPGDASYNSGALVAVPDELDKGFSDGFLGARWFADRIWVIDYARRNLRLLSGSSLSAEGPDVIPLGFQTDDEGHRTTHFARLTVEVGGESLQMLFDTGATITSTETSARPLGVKTGEQIAGSFISKAVFDRWRKAHPDWLVIAEGDAIGGHRAPLIQVPAISIGERQAGPVWFAARPSGTFEGWMSSMMDAPIVGAIGGSGLKYYRITVDYPSALARFELNLP